MKKTDLSCGQGRILKLASRARIAGVDAMFGVEKMDGNGEKEEDKEKNDVEVLFVSPGHRIPRGINIREKWGECQILSLIGHFYFSDKKTVG
jgi:hypothetical protein